MLFMLALVALSALTVSSVAIYQRGARQRLLATGSLRSLPAAPKVVEDVALSKLAPGDVVVEGDIDGVVEGVRHYREDRDSWLLAQVSTRTTRKHLLVFQRGHAETAAWLQPVEDVPHVGKLAMSMNYQGRSFALDARGDAHSTLTGEADAFGAAPVVLKYARYVAGDALVVIEEHDKHRRALSGEVVDGRALQIYSGELVRAQQQAHASNVDE